LKPNSLRQ